MKEFLQYYRILLVRAGPDSPAGQQAQERAARVAADSDDRLFVFFHGEGVAHAAGETSATWRRLAGWHDAELAVCSGSWSRRQTDPPAEPFELSSLTLFWHQAVDAVEVVCFGAAHE